MDWTAVIAVSELVATIGVIVSLVYVALQIRQNTRAVRGATAHAVTERQQTELHWSHEIADIFTKAIQTPDELTSSEAWSLSEWLSSAIVMRQNEYRQYRLGLLEEDVWEQSEGVILMLLSLPWGRNWWEVVGREQVNPDLARHIDGLLEEAELVDWSAALEALQEGPGAHRPGSSSAP